MSDQDQNLNFIENEVIYIHGQFDHTISSNIIPTLDDMILKQQNLTSRKIIIDIDSIGGYSSYLVSLLARVEYAKSKDIIIETRALSRAYSCGSMLAMSGTKKHRIISKHTTHLIHFGSAGTSNRVYHPTEAERLHTYADAHFDFVKSCYEECANIPNIDEVLQHDYMFINADKILEWGLADKLLSDINPK